MFAAALEMAILQVLQSALSNIMPLLGLPHEPEQVTQAFVVWAGLLTAAMVLTATYGIRQVAREPKHLLGWIVLISNWVVVCMMFFHVADLMLVGIAGNPNQVRAVFVPVTIGLLFAFWQLLRSALYWLRESDRMRIP